MSEREFQGYVTIRQQSDHSMFTLRASLASSKVKAALKTCLKLRSQNAEPMHRPVRRFWPGCRPMSC